MEEKINSENQNRILTKALEKGYSLTQAKSTCLHTHQGKLGFKLHVTHADISKNHGIYCQL